MDFSVARYAEIARKILDYNDWITLWFTADLPFWGKPPMAFWSVAASFALFGLNEFAARLPGLIFTLLTAWVMYRWLVKVKDKPTAVTAITLFLTSWLVIHTAGAVITDPLLMLATTLVMVGFWQAVSEADKRGAYLVWFALGIGLLSKGPVALVFCGGACGLWVLIYNQWRQWFTRIHLFSGVLLMLAIAAPWYYLAEQKTPGFFDYFIIGEHFLRFTETAWDGDLYGSVKDQPHGTIWLYFVIAMMPWSIILLARLFLKKSRQSIRDGYQSDPKFIGYLLLWALIPLVFFTIGKNVLVTYVLPSIPATCVLIAIYARQLIGKPRSLLVIALGASIVFFGLYSAAYQLYIKDHHYNQKAMVMKYLELNEQDPGPLVYWGGYRFSVVFYTHDQVEFPGPHVMQHMYPTTVYHAVRDLWISAADREPIKSRCKKVMYQAEYTLFYCPAITPEANENP